MAHEHLSADERQRIREKEAYWRETQTIQLGEEFLLFDTARSRAEIRYSDNKHFAGMKSGIRLDTPFLGKLNISITAAAYTKARYAVVTPFALQLGYPLNEEDLSFRRRLLKMSRMQRELTEEITGLYLFAFVAHEDMLLNGLLTTLLEQSATESSNEVAVVLHHLFLTLKFPNGSSFTARAFFNPQLRFILFSAFFPSDTGPLPKIGKAQILALKTNAGHISDLTEEREADKSEGFDMLLPFDIEKLQTIKANFIFLPDLD